MNEQRFPKGWDEQRVKRLIAELDARTDEEWIAADEAAGESRAAEAAKAAISSPLLEESVEGATGILLNITGGNDLGLFGTLVQTCTSLRAGDPTGHADGRAMPSLRRSDTVTSSSIAIGQTAVAGCWRRS